MAEQPRILHLTLHKKWFDEIASGEKTIEYRERSKHWRSRLTETKGGVDRVRHYDFIRFVNGYGKHRPYIIARWAGTGETGLKHKGKAQYAIKIGEILVRGNM